MSQVAPSRILAAVVLCALALPLFAENHATAEPEGGAIQQVSTSPDSIVIGFVGGFVRHDNPHHGPVVSARRLKSSVPPNTYIQVFENRHRKSAYQTILRLLDRDHDGQLSPEEKAQARIVLYGQSWGGAAAVLLARELARAGIPVLLTVQVDSVAKLWQSDKVISDNVAAAANFYQPYGIIHGRQQIVAVDPGKTRILGNYRFDYKKNPVTCEGYTWADRFFTRGHMQSECDPALWSKVETLVMQAIASPQLGLPDRAAGVNKASELMVLPQE
jgi:hypothetical protein